MKRFKAYIVYKWDNFIYEMAYQSLLRIHKRSPGICYLFLLHLESWLERNPITPELKQATEEFFRTVSQHVENITEI